MHLLSDWSWVFYLSISSSLVNVLSNHLSTFLLIFFFFLNLAVALSAAFPQTFAAFAASRHGFTRSEAQFLRLQHSPVAVPPWSNGSLTAGEERELITVTSVRWKDLQRDLTVQPSSADVQMHKRALVRHPASARSAGRPWLKTHTAFNMGEFTVVGTPGNLSNVETPLKKGKC